MKKFLIAAAFSLALLDASYAKALETHATDETELALPVAPADMLPAETRKPFILNVSWTNYMEDDRSLNLREFSPEAESPMLPQGLTVSLNDVIARSGQIQPQKLELAYTTKRNVSVRAKNRGLMVYKKFKFEPKVNPALASNAGEGVDKPRFTE